MIVNHHRDNGSEERPDKMTRARNDSVALAQHLKHRTARCLRHVPQKQLGKSWIGNAEGAATYQSSSTLVIIYGLQSKHLFLREASAQPRAGRWDQKFSGPVSHHIRARHA